MKKGVSDIRLAPGIIISVVLVIILAYAVFQATVVAAVMGSSDIASKDIATLMDVAYAAPENVEIIYEVPFDADGFPMIGTFALSSSEDKVCISPYNEDLMWEYIFNSAVTAWVGTSLLPRKKIARKIVAGPAAAKKWLIKKGAKRPILKGIYRATLKKLFTALGKKYGAKFTAAKIRVLAMSKGGAVMEASGPWGKLAASIVCSGFQIADYFITWLPVHAAIHAGYGATDEVKEDTNCYGYTSTSTPIYADPPNCEVTKNECSENKVGYGGTRYTDETCGDCPNFYISSNEDVFCEGAYCTDFMLVGAKFLCSLPLCWISSTVKGACDAGIYTWLTVTWFEKKEEFAIFFTGANIFPRDKYYYMEFPITIGISKEYDNSHKSHHQSYLHIEKNKDDLVYSREYISNE